MSEYRLIKTITDDKWNTFVAESPNGTIFSNSDYLKATGVEYDAYYCFKRNELRAGFIVVKDAALNNAVLDDFVIYNGIMYNKPTNKQNNSMQLSEQFKIQAFIAEEITKIYESINISLHSSIVDIRAFLWFNYGNELPKYIPNIRYTSYIDIKDFKTAKKLDEISCYNNASSSRRQQIRYYQSKNYQTHCATDSNLFVEFYKKTMLRQGIAVNDGKLVRMQELICSILDNNFAKIYASYDDKNELGSMAVFVWDSKRAYYLFGANDPDKRDTHCGTAVIWDAFLDLSNNGIDVVDLEGVNSPLRGWFKLSFGGNIVPYYEFSYNIK